MRPPKAAPAAVSAPVLFFEAAASRRQIRGIHQCDRVRLDPMATPQSFQQMLIDATQAAHADLLAKLVQHAPPGQWRRSRQKRRQAGCSGNCATTKFSEWVEVNSASKCVRHNWGALNWQRRPPVN